MIKFQFPTLLLVGILGVLLALGLHLPWVNSMANFLGTTPMVLLKPLISLPLDDGYLNYALASQPENIGSPDKSRLVLFDAKCQDSRTTTPDSRNRASSARDLYNQARERYNRTRDLADLNQALNCAVPAPVSTDNSDSAFLNRLSLLSGVIQWLQKTEEQLDRETWVSTASREKSEVSRVKQHWIEDFKNDYSLPRFKAILESFQLPNYFTETKKIFEGLNLAQTLSLIETSQTFQKFLHVDQSLQKEIPVLLNNALKAARDRTNVSMARQAEAYAFGYIGQQYEDRFKSGQKSSEIKTLNTTHRTKIWPQSKQCLFEAVSDPQENLIRAQQCTEAAVEVSSSLDTWDVGAYQWQWRLGRIYRQQGKRKEALIAYDTAVKTIDNMRKDLRSTDSETQFAFRDQVQLAYREYVSLLLDQGNDSTKNIEKARDLIDSLQLAELENFLACDLQITESADRLANQDPSAAIAYPIILPDRIEVILSLPQTGKQERPLVHYKTPIKSEDAELILKELRYWLEQPYISNRATKLSRDVYGWIMRGKPDPGKTSKTSECQTGECYLKASRIKTLLFVSDGALRNIPMAALKDERYLIEDYAIAISPRLQLLVPNRKAPKYPRALLAALTEKPRDPEFGKLEYANQEVTKIQNIIGNSEILTGKNFTRQNLEKEIRSGYDIVHLATHGQFNFQREQTFILTTDTASEQNNLCKNKNFPARTCLNTLENLFRENKSPIELLVLSACETASGDDRDTLGIAGMTVRTGARSAIASLWSIEDSTSVEIMKRFYNELINNKRTKAEALQQAMKTLLEDKNIYQPSQWAPYVLVGDWRKG